MWVCRSQLNLPICLWPAAYVQSPRNTGFCLFSWKQATEYGLPAQIPWHGDGFCAADSTPLLLPLASVSEARVGSEACLGMTIDGGGIGEGGCLKRDGQRG